MSDSRAFGAWASVTPASLPPRLPICCATLALGGRLASALASMTRLIDFCAASTCTFEVEPNPPRLAIFSIWAEATVVWEDARAAAILNLKSGFKIGISTQKRGRRATTFVKRWVALTIDSTFRRVWFPTCVLQTSHDMKPVDKLPKIRRVCPGAMTHTCLKMFRRAHPS